MSTFQDLFTASSLGVIAPNTSIGFPSEDTNADEWITHLRTSNVDRKLAFFDEKLDYYLTVQLKDDESPQDPPPQLLAFLSHLQVSFDAAYISSVAPTPEYIPPPNTPGAPPPVTSPPRNQSLQAQPNKFRHLPSLFPPSTPHPIPSAAESDKQYVRSEGTPLSAGVWGESPSESFQLLWSETEKSWIAVYKLVVDVSFVRMNFTDPLLSLTVSTTLREKPAPFTGPRKRLAELIDAAGGPASVSITPVTPWRKKEDKQVDEEDEDDHDSELVGFEEVNLLGGLYSAPTFKSEEVAIPSTRLGPMTRHETFFLPPLHPIVASPSSSPTPTQNATHVQTLRKSFRKTLKTVSGFRVRMRTVFVPYVLFPAAQTKKDQQTSATSETNSDSEDEDTKWDRERKEAGNDESTVVLCVEVLNSGESGMGFVVESVDVHISGEGAKTTLIQWGFNQSQTTSIFPLRVGRMEQYNLLYAVTFLDAPNTDEFGNGSRKQVEMQRAVTIDINGKPYDVQDADGGTTSYPTRTFSSRWNCVLDLSANINKELVGVPVEAGGTRFKEALPTPASPFPGAGPSTIRPRAASLLHDDAKSVAGSKRHTLGSISPGQGMTIRAPVNYRSSTSMLNPAFQKEREGSQTPLSGPGTFTPPSMMFQSTYHRAATTYGSRTTSPPPLRPAFDEEVFQPPPTPAYPAFPNTPAGAVYSQAPATSTQSSVGPSVEIRRGLNNRVVGGAYAMGEDEERREGGELIVVSVGLLPFQEPRNSAGSEEMIYPNDKFTLDIFVLNQSSWIRRLEVSYPDGRSLRKKLGEAGKHNQMLGIMPLENRIRVGPLRPSTCQSVRMNFLALAPGVHNVDTLTLTDIETGYAVNLRSVMDIVVHEPPLADA